MVHIKRASVPVSRVAIAAISSVALAGLAALPATAGAAGTKLAKEYTVSLQPLNRSGVTGTADVMLQDKTLTVKFDATGLEPNMVHDAHIHGMLNGTDASCPTTAADTNGDGYVSVFEGAPDYGPIKVSLTDPITPPGPNPVAALFAPYAGSDSNNFQNADGQGADHYDQSFTYDLSDAEAAAAYEGIMPLEAQEIVIHGAMAPESVDTMGGDPAKMVYDDLLPVACGDLRSAMRGQPTMVPAATDTPSTEMNEGQTPNMPGMPMEQAASSGSQNVDQQVSGMYEARNAMIDMLNRAGDVVARDRFLAQADAMIQKFREMAWMR